MPKAARFILIYAVAAVLGWIVNRTLDASITDPSLRDWSLIAGWAVVILAATIAFVAWVRAPSAAPSFSPSAEKERDKITNQGRPLLDALLRGERPEDARARVERLERLADAYADRWEADGSLHRMTKDSAGREAIEKQWTASLPANDYEAWLLANRLSLLLWLVTHVRPSQD